MLHISTDYEITLRGTRWPAKFDKVSQVLICIKGLTRRWCLAVIVGLSGWT